MEHKTGLWYVGEDSVEVIGGLRKGSRYEPQVALKNMKRVVMNIK